MPLNAVDAVVADDWGYMTGPSRHARAPQGVRCDPAFRTVRAGHHRFDRYGNRSVFFPDIPTSYSVDSDLDLTVIVLGIITMGVDLLALRWPNNL